MNTSTPSLLPLLASLGLLLGCATIISSPRQPVAVRSDPARAAIYVDGVPSGTTPAVLTLARNTPHTVRFALEGYRPLELRLERRVNGWVWGNILLGGLVGLVVDASTGAMYRLSPEQLEASLHKTVAVREAGASDLVLSVVLEAEPGWEPVGHLEPEPERARALGSGS